MYKPLFNQRKALRFRQFTRKGYALFACLGRVVTIGVLSVATLKSAAATTADDVTVTDGNTASVVVSDDTIDKEARLDDVEVTGSRAPLALGQAARMVTVLSREDIQAAPVQSINDLLKYAVGVDVRQRGPIGAQTDIGIRGSTSEQITILLNGINICDPQTGHNAFDLPCDISDIERIEVLEGPAGRVYGTSSLVGAINVVTNDRGKEQGEFATPHSAEQRRGKRNVEARIEGGSFGYLSAAANYSLTRGQSVALQSLTSNPLPLTSTISASYTRSDGYSRSKAGALNSDYTGGKVFYQGSYSLTRGQSVALQSLTYNLLPLTSKISWYAGLSMKGFGSNTFYSAKFDEQYEQTTKLYTAIKGETSGWINFSPSIYWNRSYDRFELIRGSEEKVPFNHHRTDVFGVNLNSWFDWVLGRTAFGAEFRNEDIVSSNLGEALNEPHGNYKVGLNRSNLSFHLEHNILLRRFTLSAGFIAVKNTWNQMPFTVYPGIDASYRIGDNFKIYTSYNSSLRMPSFTELYYSVGGHKADRYLKPEELRAVEGGVKYQSRLLSVKAGVFHHHQRNTIDWVMDTREADPVWQSVNLTRVNTLGVETTLNCQLSTLNCQLSYCYLHQSKDMPEHMQSQYALEYLRHKLTVQLQAHLFGKLDLTLCYRFQDRMGSYTDTDGQIQLYHPYSVVDARLAWDADTYSIYIAGNNLTCHRYVDYGNVRQPGLWLTVGAKYHIRL